MATQVFPSHLVFRPRSQTVCPECGERVKKIHLRCERCGQRYHDLCYLIRLPEAERKLLTESEEDVALIFLCGPCRA